jgi:photosystem II stability/assembly factor-like uncharacterized protein
LICSSVHHLKILFLFLGAHLLWSASIQGQDIRALRQSAYGLVQSEGRWVMLSSNGALFTSENAGQTLQQRRVATGDDFYALSAVLNIVIAAGQDGLILRSADGGLNWAQVQAPALFGDLRAVAGRTRLPAPNQQWLAAGDNGLDAVIVQSVDAGQNWSLLRIILDDVNEGFPVGVTLNSLGWTGETGAISAFWLAGGENFAGNGVIYRSVDGERWSTIAVPAGAGSIDAFAVEPPLLVLAAGQGGTLLLSRDAGASFERFGEGVVSGSLTAAYSLGGGRFLVGGNERTVLLIETASGSPTATVLAEPTAGDGPVYAFTASTTANRYIVAGDFKLLNDPTGTIRLSARPAPGNPARLLIIAEGAEPGRSYLLENSSNQTDWEIVPGASQSTGAQITWEIDFPLTTLYFRIRAF